MEKTSLQLKDFDDFITACKHFGIEINNNQLGQFKKYYETLIEWNKKINLISRKEENVLEKHFLDSLLFLPEINDFMQKRGSRRRGSGIPPSILDIGSGGGFPGIPLAIMLPECNFVLCESIKKKTRFLNYLINELGLQKVKIINERVENIRAIRELPQQYDFITVRAVAKLDELIKYAKPLLISGGCLFAYKAKNIDEEITGAKELIERNSLKLKIFSKNLNAVERKLVVIS